MRESGYQRPIASDDMASGPFLAAVNQPGGYDQALFKKLDAAEPKAISWYRGQQAAFMVKKLVSAFASGVKTIFVSTDTDWWFYFMPQWRHMGLLDKNGVAKPAYYTYKLMVEKLDGFTTAEMLAQGVYKFSFDRKEPVLVVWSDSGKKLIDLSAQIPTQTLKVTPIVSRLDGRNQPIYSASSLHPSHAIPVTSQPIFIEPN